LLAARAAGKKDLRAALLQRAQVWLELAQWQEEQERQESLLPSSSPSQGTHSPVQQQQLQIQIKKDKGKSD
jgi:hypothetical protein